MFILLQVADDVTKGDGESSQPEKVDKQYGITREFGTVRGEDQGVSGSFPFHAIIVAFLRCTTVVFHLLFST